jgi:hypothetical protein
MTTNYTKRPLIIPNGHKIFQMAIKYTNIYHSKALQNLPKFWIFGLKTNHLATLNKTRAFAGLALKTAFVGSAPHFFSVSKYCNLPIFLAISFGL